MEMNTGCIKLRRFDKRYVAESVIDFLWQLLKVRIRDSKYHGKEFMI